MKKPDRRINLENIKNKSIFITGGTGFFGRWLLGLLKFLNSQGYNINVTILSRSPHSFINNQPQFGNAGWIHWVTGDIQHYEFPSESYDLFIHGAAETKPDALQHTSAVFNSIVHGTRRIMEHSAAAKARRILIISSGAAYGEVPLGIERIPEDLNTGPRTNETRNAYGEAKRAAEMLASCYAKDSGMEIVIARCFSFFGPGIGNHLVLTQLATQAMYQDAITILGNGMAKRSFLHCEDLAIWLVKLLIDGKPGEIYNIGSDLAYSIKELAELVRNEIAPLKKVLVLGTLKDEVRMNYVPSIEKAKSLGLDVWIPLHEAIRLWHAEQ